MIDARMATVVALSLRGAAAFGLPAGRVVCRLGWTQPHFAGDSERGRAAGATGAHAAGATTNQFSPKFTRADSTALEVLVHRLERERHADRALLRVADQLARPRVAWRPVVEPVASKSTTS